MDHRRVSSINDKDIFICYYEDKFGLLGIMENKSIRDIEWIIENIKVFLG